MTDVVTGFRSKRIDSSFANFTCCATTFVPIDLERNSYLTSQLSSDSPLAWADNFCWPDKFMACL